MTARVVGQMNEHLLAEPAAAKGRTDIHALELAVLRAVDLDAAATRRHPSLPDDEESDLFAEQLADAIPGGGSRSDTGTQDRFPALL